MFRVATAECFTHGLVAREIHLKRKEYGVVVVCGLFLPTIDSLKIIGIEPPKPVEVVDGIKVYDEDGDKEMAIKMAEAVKKKVKADVGIGTCAGIGRGCVAVVTANETLYAFTDVYANFLTSPLDEILKRQESGVKKAIELFEKVLACLKKR